MQDNTGKEKEGILDLGPGPGGRLLNPARLDKPQGVKILGSCKVASENKRFYRVGNRTKRREICFVFRDKISK